MEAHIIIAIISVIGGATGTKLIDAYSQRKVTGAKAEATLVDSANVLMAAQQVQIDRLEHERGRLETRVTGLQAEVNNLHVALREERLRCDSELHGIKLELSTAMHHINNHLLAMTPSGGVPVTPVTGTFTVSETPPTEGVPNA